MGRTTVGRIPVAVVGTGWVGMHRHLPTLQADKRFQLIGVIDHCEERLAAAAKQFGLGRAANAVDLDAVPWIDEISALSIATPPGSHARLIGQARARGLHVLTEKPFTLDMADAERLAAPGGPVLAVMHNFQFARSAARLWADMADNRLGRVRSVSAIQLSNPDRRLPEWYEELPLGLFFDESPHLLYLLRRAAPGLTLRHLDMVPGLDGRHTPRLLSARYAAGPNGDLPVSLSMNFEATVSEWHLIVQGERAAGVLDIFRDIYLRVPNDGAHTTSSVLRSSLSATVGHWAGYLGSGALHLSGRLRYGVDVAVDGFGRAIEAGHDPEFHGRLDALAVRRMQQEIIDGAARLSKDLA